MIINREVSVFTFIYYYYYYYYIIFILLLLLLLSCVKATNNICTFIDISNQQCVSLEGILS
jgi:hypothetical protein